MYRILLNGLSLGSVYAIIALGYTMVYGIAKMLNFAHGDVIMIGAYVALLSHDPVRNVTGWWQSLFLMVVCTVLGILVEKIAYQPTSKCFVVSGSIDHCDWRKLPVTEYCTSCCLVQMHRLSRL